MIQMKMKNDKICINHEKMKNKKQTNKSQLSARTNQEETCPILKSLNLSLL